MNQFIQLVRFLLSFLKKKEKVGEVEFSELVKGQYTYLLEIIEKFQKDYFLMAGQLKEMNEEMILLNLQLKEALALQYKEYTCVNRV